MKHCSVTVQIDGEIIREQSIPVFLLPFVKWLCKMCGSTLSVSDSMDY